MYRPFSGLHKPTHRGVSFDNTTRTMQWRTAQPDGDHGTIPIRQQLDFLVVTFPANTPVNQRAFSIMEEYTAAVGHAPSMPPWAAQYFHSKNRYTTQEDLLTAARYFHAKKLPVGVLVIDWFHVSHHDDASMIV